MTTLDPTIAALADFAATLGEPVPARFVSQQQLLAGAMAMFCCVVGFASAQSVAYQPTEESAQGARHLGYSEGVRKAPRRQTAADRQRAEAAKWGLVR